MSDIFFQVKALFDRLLHLAFGLDLVALTDRPSLQKSGELRELEVSRAITEWLSTEI